MPDLFGPEGTGSASEPQRDARGARRRLVTFRVVGVAQPKGSTRSFGFIRRNPATGAPYVKSNGHPIIGTKTTSDNPRLGDWQRLVAAAAQTQVLDYGMARGSADPTTKFQIFAGAVTLSLVFYLPRPQSLPKKVTEHLKKPDLDKLVRAVKDALTGVLWRDDSQVTELLAKKRYAFGTVPCSVFVTVEEPGPVYVQASIQNTETSTD